MKEKDGDPGYQSFGFTFSSVKGIDGFADFRGKKVCFVDETSTSGYLYPKAGLSRAGLYEDAYTKVMAGGHDASVLSVAGGDCDAGFATDDMVGRQLIEEGKIKQGQLKTVWKSAVIPGSPAALFTDLAKELRTEIADAFATKANADYLESKGYCDGDDCLLEGNWGHVPVEDADCVCAATDDAQCEAGS